MPRHRTTFVTKTPRILRSPIHHPPLSISACEKTKKCKMGSERKSKEKNIKKRNSVSSGSEDEQNSKRRRTGEDGERRDRKSDKKEKLKVKKYHDHTKRHSDKEKKSKDKHKSKNHKSDRHLKHEVQELSNDDYFSKNNEFATWLKEEKNVFFSELSSESAHELFSDFVKAWNKQKLESRYYEGITRGPRTSHHWKIKG
ncbi:style cell-cycle inhibitor 1-A [Juglans regia]|uniref:Style cell-cycle inhibitor 1-A n=2 Tax=Juglans regia TaxID=51240 RepID=A0A2I4FEB4_JUGRE|nr:style cell-cycle inhibitor 1-A [Juglans regia]